jgi:hypothetical protein
MVAIPSCRMPAFVDAFQLVESCHCSQSPPYVARKPMPLRNKPQSFHVLLHSPATLIPKLARLNGCRTSDRTPNDVPFRTPVSKEAAPSTTGSDGPRSTCGNACTCRDRFSVWPASEREVRVHFHNRAICASHKFDPGPRAVKSIVNRDIRAISRTVPRYASNQTMGLDVAEARLASRSHVCSRTILTNCAMRKHQLWYMTAH